MKKLKRINGINSMDDVVKFLQDSKFVNGFILIGSEGSAVWCKDFASRLILNFISDTEKRFLDVFSNNKAVQNFNDYISRESKKTTKKDLDSIYIG